MQQILRSVVTLPTWDVDAFDKVVVALGRLLDKPNLQWEPDTDERWAWLRDGKGEGNTLCAQLRAPQVGNPEKRFAFVWSGYPAADAIIALLRDADVDVVVLDDFEAEQLWIAVDDFAVFNGGAPPPADVFDLSCFDADDFVFITG
jgi:hypothetical protein